MQKSAYRAICSLLVFIIVFFVSAIAETALPDISSMSIEDLLRMRDEINAQLESKGYIVYYDIERGAKGEEVSAIQERLSELGFYAGKTTGKFDSETQKAFKAFEKANGLQNDGLASREDQLILFGDAALAKVSEEPALEATPAPQKRAKSELEHDVSFDYVQYMRYPDEHIGETYRLKGKVEQVLGNRTDGFQIRFSVLGNSSEIIYVNIADPGYNILEGDWLIIDLTMSGTVTYESIWGQEITIPQTFASKIDLI